MILCLFVGLCNKAKWVFESEADMEENECLNVV